ncbi:TetR/AcrR family transcriptional regulator [Thermocatellispora tengchongensis]|uniref:TetR/AcrR family transcriptional regulator n=1 Tax=Thermocatellispora tengchongensis TaxID=1073253 RepID=UPI0036278F93
MGRLTRAEAQERNRAAVLAAARDEFAERGFRDTKIDGIAERAGLTRGAVYSNFPGKRALYFAVLAEQAERRAPGSPPRPVRTVGAALAALARAWVAGLPLATAGPGAPPFAGTGLSADVLGEEPVRRAYAQLMTLDALLLGLALERLGPGRGERRVRLAQAVLTTLHGASRMAADAPGFVEPFDVIAACEHLASLGMDDAWRPPHLPWAAPARPADEPWSPPRALDLVRGEPARLAADGVVAVLGLHRLDAAEEAVRAAPPGTRVTVAMVTAEPGELAPWPAWPWPSCASRCAARSRPPPGPRSRSSSTTRAPWPRRRACRASATRPRPPYGWRRAASPPAPRAAAPATPPPAPDRAHRAGEAGDLPDRRPAESATLWRSRGNPDLAVGGPSGCAQPRGAP